MQYSVISTGIPCLYGSQPLSVVFGCTTATFGAELQVSMGPRQNLSFCAWKTATLAPELLVSMCPSPHLWFLHAQQRILDQNFKSLWDPVLICGFCMPNSDFRTRLTSLYGSQTSSVVLSTHNCELNTRIKRQYWIQPSPVALCIQNSDFRTRITSL